MREVASIAVGNRSGCPTSVLAGFEFNFGNARKVFAHFILIVSSGSPEMMKPDLLIEIQIGFRTFLLVRITGIKNTFPVSSPGSAAPAGRVLHSLDFIG